MTSLTTPTSSRQRSLALMSPEVASHHWKQMVSGHFLAVSHCMCEHSFTLFVSELQLTADWACASSRPWCWVVPPLPLPTCLDLHPSLRFPHLTKPSSLFSYRPRAPETTYVQKRPSSGIKRECSCVHFAKQNKQNLRHYVTQRQQNLTVLQSCLNPNLMHLIW